MRWGLKVGGFFWKIFFVQKIIYLDIGRLHYVPLQPRPGTFILVTVRLLLSKDNDVMLAAQGLALRWMRLSKFLIRRQGCSVMEVCLN